MTSSWKQTHPTLHLYITVWQSVRCVTLGRLISLSLWLSCSVSVQLHVVAVTALWFLVKLFLNFAFHNSRDKSVHLYVSPVVYKHDIERKDFSNLYLMNSIPNDIFNVTKAHNDWVVWYSLVIVMVPHIFFY